MSRALYKKGRSYRTATIITGLSIILVTTFFGVTASFVLFPIFAVFLFLYLFKATGKINLIFAGYLVCTMVTELLFLYDYQEYINYTTLISSVSSILMLLLVKPAIPKGTSTFSKHNIVELIIGFIGVGFGFGYLTYMVIPLVPDISVFVLGLLTFIVATTICFVIPNLNRHPDNSLLLGTGSAYIAEISFAFVYEYLSKELLFLLASILMGCFVKIILATYLARMDTIKDYDNTLDLH